MCVWPLSPIVQFLISLQAAKNHRPDGDNHDEADADRTQCVLWLGSCPFRLEADRSCLLDCLCARESSNNANLVTAMHSPLQALSSVEAVVK